MGVVEVAALRPCPVPDPRPFHLAFVCALSPIRCYFTITLYDAQFRTNSLTFARAPPFDTLGTQPCTYASGIYMWRGRVSQQF